MARRRLVELLRRPHLVAPDPHQRLGGGDPADPTPQVPLAPVLADAPDHLEERLLQHVFGILGAAQDAERQVVHGRLERPVQRFERFQIA